MLGGMNISFLIQVLENRIKFLTEQRQFALLGGDLDTVNRYDQDLSETQLTLDALKTL